MSQAKMRRLSKLLSLILRHRPEKIGLQLDAGGWVEVNTLLEAMKHFNHPLDRPTLEQLVRENDKQRFSFSPDRKRLRANQGHSIEVDLGLSPAMPPATLFHGTADTNLPSILEKGLLRQRRQHVHLSADPVTAHHVGKRHGHPLILQIAAKAMQEEGFVFFLSDNSVWLTNEVPPRFLKETTL